jgi:Flp pilus assembly protein TadD
MLRQFHDSENAEERHLAAWACVLAPNAVNDMEEPIGLARRDVEIRNANPDSLLGLGAVLFRAGRFQEAMAALERCEPTFAPATSGFFRAMTCFKLGQDDEARSWYDKAVAATAKVLKDNASDAFGHIKLQILRDESTQMLGITDDIGTTDDEPRPNDHQQEVRSGSPTSD